MNAYYTDEARASGEPTPRPKALVIGSGFGGLAAAIRLSVMGYEVQVLEQLDGPGGRAYVFAQDGYTFDAGPTIITAPFLLEELWALCGRLLQDDVDLRLMEPFYRIRFDDGRIFDYNANDEQMERQIATFDARDVKGFRRLVEVAERCRRIGFEGMGSIAFDRFIDLIKALPGFARMQAWRTIYGVVAKHLRHPQLRIAFSFHTLLIGGNPFSVTSAYALIHSLERRWGVHSVMGGTGALVRGMVKLLQQRGVAIRYQARVAEITVEAGRATGVRLANGETLAADIVVSNADSAWTYKHLVRREHRRHWSDSRIERGRYSMGLFVWYFGTKRRYEEVPHHTMVLGPRYKGLLRDIFKRKHLADDFSLYLHRPTATDPSLAPPGCDTFYALSPVPHLDSGTDWRTHAERYRQAIQTRLETTVLPGLGAELTTSRLMTPLDFQDRLASYKGAGFGLEPLLLQSAWFRPHNRSEDVDGLYLVGAATHPGAGVPGVLMSAKALQTVVPTVQAWRAAQTSKATL